MSYLEMEAKKTEELHGPRRRDDVTRQIDRLDVVLAGVKSLQRAIQLITTTA